MHRSRITKFFLACAVSMSGAAASAADADAFPRQPMRVMVGFAAGSTTDILARVVATKLGDAWGKPVVVENRPGAGGVISAQAVLAAPPDGHTLLVVSAGHAVSAALYPKLPYDTERDFSGVSLLANVPSILVVANNAPVKSVKDLVAHVRQNPDGQYSSPGIGSANHLAGALFGSLAEARVEHVPYKGIPQALQAAMTGEVLFNFSPVVNVLPAAGGGKVLALAASTAKRAAAMPDLPTVAEAGLPGYAFDPWFGLLAASKVPRPVVAKLNREVVRILGLPDVKKQLLGMGAEPTPTTPEAFDAQVRDEIRKFAKLARDANIKVE